MQIIQPGATESNRAAVARKVVQQQEGRAEAPQPQMAWA